jgi:hypothetical protein
MMAEFYNKLWTAVIDLAMVMPDKRIVFRLKDGMKAPE